MNSAVEPAVNVQPEAAAPRVSVALMAALVILTCGHVLSNLLRTTPAMAIDLMAVDLKSSAQTLAALTSAYHFFFALLQIPIGVALDRYSIRTVSLVLFAGTTVNIVSDRNTGFLIAVVLGAIVSWLWPWVIGMIFVRRARGRQQDRMHDEVERQVAAERAKDAEHRAG